MLNLLKGVVKTNKVVDQYVLTNQEKESIITERHKIDMASDSILSKTVRPAVLYLFVLLEIFIVISEGLGLAAYSTDIKIQVGVILSTVLGFYFNSKKAERVAEKHMRANLDYKKLEIKEKEIEIKASKRKHRNLN